MGLIKVKCVVKDCDWNPGEVEELEKFKLLLDAHTTEVHLRGRPVSQTAVATLPSSHTASIHTLAEQELEVEHEVVDKQLDKLVHQLHGDAIKNGSTREHLEKISLQCKCCLFKTPVQRLKKARKNLERLSFILVLKDGSGPMLRHCAAS